MQKLIYLFSFLIALGCNNQIDLVKIAGHTMGTGFSIKYEKSKNTPGIKEVEKRILDELKLVNNSLSTYQKDSEVSKFNQLEANKWFELSEMFLEVYLSSRNIQHESTGMFDPTVGPLVNLWGFGPNKSKVMPIQDQIENALKIVGLHNVIVFDGKNKLKKTNKSVYLDFSASAKGYGVDRLALVLESLGIFNYMVEIGGEIKVSSKTARTWTLGIERPDISQMGVQKVITVKNLAMATSGNYRNFIKNGEVTYAHTINPLTGSSGPSNLLSATVLADQCMDADAWATAFMAMGLEKAMEVSYALDIAAYFITKSDTGFKEHFSSSWEKYMVVQ